MQETFGNLWDSIGKVEVIFITTNLATKTGGKAILGRGNALEALKRWPNIDDVLGRYLTQGNYNPVPLWRISKPGDAIQTQLWSFPVKDIGFLASSEEELDNRCVDYKRQVFKPRQFVPSWAQKASLERITESAKYVQGLDIKSAMLPRPGVGHGQLSWTEVSNVIEPILDNRFTTITWK